VLQGGVYIKYAEGHTVEVICMEEIDRALRDENRLVRTFKVTDAYGDDVHQLAELPGLTVEDLKALYDSKAFDYVKGNRMPYTTIVDPHTLKEMDEFQGGYSAKDLIARVQKQYDRLKANHGEGLSRTVWRQAARAQIEIDLLLAEGKLAKALSVYRQLAKETLGAPKPLPGRVAASLEVILDDAGKRLDLIERRIGAGESSKIKNELRTLQRALAGTALEKRAFELVERANGKKS